MILKISGCSAKRGRQTICLVERSVNSFVHFKAKEERDEQKKRADNLQSKIKTLEKDNKEVHVCPILHAK